MIKNKITKEELEKLYIGDKWGSALIARKLQISRSSVQLLLKTYGIPTRKIHAGRDMNLSGNKFGLLTVLEPDKDYQKRNNLSNRNRYWKCRCECGNVAYAVTNELRAGIAKSCGCLRSKQNSQSHHWKGHGQISSHFFAQIIRSAANRGLVMQVTIEQLWDLFVKQNGKCALTGVDIKFAESHKENPTASVDRIDSKLGYIVGNIQFVHKDINIMKLDHSQDRFVELCNLVSDYNRISK